MIGMMPPQPVVIKPCCWCGKLIWIDEDKHIDGDKDWWHQACWELFKSAFEEE